MNDQQQERIEQLLKKSLPRTADPVHRDLWPAMLKRMRMDDQARPFPVPWFDWALLAAVAAWLLFFPSTIPLLLYHL